MTTSKLTAEHRLRRAFVYVRQSSPIQLQENHESRRRQYHLEEHARELGFSDVEVIDDDLAVTASGLKERPGFERLVAAVCTGKVGAVFCSEASRLARNGRDWHHLLELCALTGTLLIDPRGVYDPRSGNDRLLLGLQGVMSEYELTLLRERSAGAIRSLAERGELRFALPIGFCWTHDGRLEREPDTRVQEAIALVFDKFREMGSARQVLLWFRSEGITLPAIQFGTFGREIVWKAPVYNTILKHLQNPLFAGAYAWGKTEDRIQIVGGRAKKSRGHRKPREEWTVLIREHHSGYIEWAEYLRNQQTLAENAHMKKRMGRKSGRGGRSLLAGMLRCRRCGRMLHVTYSGVGSRVPRYHCRGAHVNHGADSCISFGGLRIDETIAAEVLRAVEGSAIDAAVEAAERLKNQGRARRRTFELELEQAHYRVIVARRRFEAVDPDNRLVAGELEATWELALQQESEVQRRLEEVESDSVTAALPSQEVLETLALDLPRVWNDPRTDMKLKQRIVHILINEIIADIDDEASEIVLTIHWTGGNHTELRVHKNRTGHHRHTTGLDAQAAITAMVGRFADDRIAATLNRLGLRTGKGNSWNESRVRSYRSHRSLPAFDPDNTDPQILTLAQAAGRLDISTTSARRLVADGTLPGTQVIKCAPWEIPAEGIEFQAVKEAVARIRMRSTRPRTPTPDIESLTIPGL